MGKVKGKHRLDKYYRLAKEHGYRSRAAWKLVQIDAKFSFLRSSHAVLDLCAAPGGWMQAAVERMPVGSLVVGIDLVPIAPIRGAISIEEDITKTECKAKIKRVMGEHGCRTFDLVLHDGSPNVGGAWAKDATSQNALVIDSVKLASQFLAPKGNFVTKVFRSQDYSSVLYCLKQLFDKVEVFKPPASRSTSAEIYVLGFRYKAPAKIDPRLLDVKHLFQGSLEPKKVVDVLRGTKQKRHRDGYEEGETMFKKVSSATEFVMCDNPIEVLGSVTRISFADPACLLIKDNPLTTEEVKSLCDDLRVLGKQDFKQLLKWRIHMKKALSPVEKVDAASIEVQPESKEDEDEKLLTEMEDLTNAMERKKKRVKKILAKRQAKDKTRKATGMQVDAMLDGYTDHDLFSLSSMKDKKDLAAVDSTEYDDGNYNMGDSDNEEINEKAEDHTDSDLDSDEERKRYDEQEDAIFEQAYEKYVSLKDGSTKQRKRARQMYAEDGQLLEGDDENAIQSDHDSDKDEHIHEANPLMVLEEMEPPTQNEVTNRFYSHDIFEALDEEELHNKSDSEDETKVVVPKPNKKILLPKKPEEIKPAKQSAISHQPKKNQNSNLDDDDDFEIVPAPGTDSSDSSSSDESEIDDDSKAEILATAKNMLRKKQREQILDDSYNKYMFDDTNLPTWFIEEERKHRIPNKPFTKEEANAIRAQMREIDARPAKKVAQAKARKKRVAVRKLEKVRKTANTISDQADINDRSKRKMIEQLYKKATPQRPKKEYVVAKKGVQVRQGKGKVLVDPRMKKDTRAVKAAAKQGKGGSKKGKKSKSPKGKGSASNGSASKGNSKGGGGGYKGRKTGNRN